MATSYPPQPNLALVNQKTGNKKKRPPNTGSKLLNNQENYLLYQFLGDDNISLSAAIVQLLEGSNRSWQLLHEGVLCLVKDYVKRAYYMRIFSFPDGEKLWEFHLYKGFQASATVSLPELLTFEGERDSKIFGLNFCDKDEARDFKSHLDKRREQESKGSTVKSTPPSSSVASPFLPVSSRPPPMPLGGGGVTPMGTVAHTAKTPSSSRGVGLFKKDKSKGKKTIRKEDISNPTNFQHRAHVGWDQDNGFSNNVYDSEPMDESIKNIIRAAGQDPTQMSKKTIKFVYDFIGNYQEDVGSHDATPLPSTPSSKAPPPSIPSAQPVSQWNTPPPPPPPPSRGASHQSSIPVRPPPPPPNDMLKTPVRSLPQVPSQESYRPMAVPPPPPPPPPSGAGSSAPAPPPPPPPPPMSTGSAPPPPPPPPPSGLTSGPNRGNLLAEIQAGRQLKSVTTTNAPKSAPPGGRDDVMAQIRQGAQLKHVDTTAEQEKRKSAGPAVSSDMGGIAGALARALEERRFVLGVDDSSDEDDSDDNNEWAD